MQQQHTAQGVRLVSNASTSNVRVLSSGQTVRIATSQPGSGHVGSPINTTILRQQPTVLTSSPSSGVATGTIIAGTTGTAGGKQILLQKPISLSGQNVLQLVKTSQGMAVQSLPKVNVVQKAGTSIQQQIASGAQIVTGSNQGKTALIGTNVVKLMSPGGVGNKILMKNSNLVQVGKMGTTAGKPSFVITNKQGQTIRTNQQFIFVTTAGGIRTVQSGSIVTSSASNFVSLVSSPQINTITSAIASGTNSVGTPTGTVKMIRSVGQQGKPITFTLPVGGIQGNKTGTTQLISMPQKAFIGGKAVTVQLAPGNQKTVTIVSSSGAGGIQKTINAADLQAGGHKIVMMPSKRVTNISNVITHKAIPVSATDSGHVNVNPNTGDNNLEVLDQLDGAFDMDDSDSDSDENIASDSETHKEKVHDQKKRFNNLLNISNRSGITKRYRKSKVEITKKHLPKYVKMGLFGGAPPTENTSNENQESDEQVENENNDSTASLGQEATEDVEMPDTQIKQLKTEDTSEEVDGNASQLNDEQQTLTESTTKQEATNETAPTDESTSGYLNTISGSETTNANTSTGEEYINTNDSDEQSGQIPSQRRQKHHAEPTASDTEAANILTTIKSGELLRNNDIKTENGNILSSPTSMSIGGHTLDDNVKILFNNEPAIVTSSKSGVSGMAIKTVQKSAGTITTYTTSNTGDLDALASAALQASSGTTFCLN